MTLPPTHVWLNALLLGLQSVQAALLWGLHALGIAGDSHGAPAWPWNVRIAGENLVIDVALARQFAWMLAALAFALVCVLIAIGWRRARRWALAAAIAALVFAPWSSSADEFSSQPERLHRREHRARFARLYRAVRGVPWRGRPRRRTASRGTATLAANDGERTA
jgi:phosphotransferase system  glucose/maltose/N-acetylglucosamine-specific IIC component